MKPFLFLSFLFLNQCAMSQTDSLPVNLQIGDTLGIVISKESCHISYKQYVQIYASNDSQMVINYSSYHFSSYFFSNDKKPFIHHRKNRQFLKTNNINRNIRYQEEELPWDSLKGECPGLISHRFLKIKQDSFRVLPIHDFSLVHHLFTEVCKETLRPKGLIFAGNYTYFNFTFYRHGILTTHVVDKRIKGWYDFIVPPSPLLN